MSGADLAVNVFPQLVQEFSMFCCGGSSLQILHCQGVPSLAILSKSARLVSEHFICLWIRCLHMEHIRYDELTLIGLLHEPQIVGVGPGFSSISRLA